LHKSKLTKVNLAYIETIGSARSTIDRAMKDYDLVAKQASGITAALGMESLALGSSITDQLSSFTRLNSTLTQGLAAFDMPKTNLDFIGALTSSATLKDYTKGIAQQINDMINLLGFSSMESLALESSIKDQLSSFTGLNSALTQGLAAFDMPKIGIDYIETIGSARSSIDRAMRDYDLVAKQASGITAALGMESLALGSNLFQEILESMEEEELAILNTRYTPLDYEISSTVELLSNDIHPELFIEKFQNFSIQVKIVILWIFKNIFLTIILSIAANMLMPYINNYLESSSDKSNIDKVRHIKKIPKKIITEKIDTTYLRFISTDVLNVRYKPSTTKSKIIDQLTLGKIVEVLDKRKNWIKISYDKDNKTIKGWVFTRHTKKFDK